ncbi:hypothetical protein DIE12_28175 [Burkholderia sp. Bp9015]|nr:hypothetical protein DIE12_28175 [Burkholderia sp. Bp9015]
MLRAWLLGRLVAWLLGCLVAWSLGRLVAWSLGRQACRLHRSPSLTSAPLPVRAVRDYAS